MSDPFVGEIRMFAGNYAPAGWMSCNGQLVPISEYEILFNLIGTTYGGDGQQTFALPNLQSRLPVYVGPGFPLGQMGGREEVTLTVSQMPTHGHPMVVSRNPAANNAPLNNLTGQVGATQIYREAAPATAMAASAVTVGGGNQPHSNIQPFLCLNFIISMFGIYPSQN